MPVHLGGTGAVVPDSKTDKNLGWDDVPAGAPSGRHV
jgi:hypothetical protein